jgi:hypothetical protein
VVAIPNNRAAAIARILLRIIVFSYSIMASATLREHPPTWLRQVQVFKWAPDEDRSNDKLFMFDGMLWSSLVIRMHKLKKTHDDSFDLLLTSFGSIKWVFQQIDVQNKIATAAVIGIRVAGWVPALAASSPSGKTDMSVAGPNVRFRSCVALTG